MTDGLRMHGPVEFEMHVFVVNDETGQQGKATIGGKVFEYPTPEFVANRLKELEAGELDEVAPGFRLMGREEAWEFMCLEKFGEVYAVPGRKLHEWDAIE